MKERRASLIHAGMIGESTTTIQSDGRGLELTLMTTVSDPDAGSRRASSLPGLP